MNKAELEKAIEREVEEWPGVKVEFVSGGKHPKAKFWFLGNVLARPYPGTPSDGSFGVHRCLGDVRRTLKQLGAQRSKPEPSQEEDEAPYRKPNDGAEKRPHPVAGEKAALKPDLIDQGVAAGLRTPEQGQELREGLVSRFDTPGIAPVEEVPDGPPIDDLMESIRRAGLDLSLVGTVSRSSVIACAADLIEDGVYFDLPAEIYHAVPRLSSSGLQNLCVSPATFWARSWLNPEREEKDEDETKAQVLGRAYHCARLEPNVFHDRYVREPSKSDYPAEGLLTSDVAVKAALKDLGEQQTVTGESIEERCGRLAAAGYEGTIWPLVKAVWEREDLPGRTPIPAKYFDQMVTDMERIRDHGEIAPLLSGGASEVSVFWTDPHGLKCKARFDYLTVEHWTDLKTFDNSRGKALEQAIADAVRFNRYHIQGVHYRDGAEAIRTGGLDVKGEATDAQRELIAKVRIRPGELACWFVFQEKGGVPNLLARELAFFDVPGAIENSWDTGASDEAIAAGHDATSRPTQLFTRGRWEIDQAKREFVLYSQAYDPGQPWFPLNARGRLDEFYFSTYWLEGKA